VTVHTDVTTRSLGIHPSNVRYEWSQRIGILFVIFGGLAVLQSSQQLTTVKDIYLAGCLLALLGAVVRVRQLMHVESLYLVKPLLLASAMFALLVIASAGVAHANGTPLASWARDAAPYFLFAATPLFAINANSSFSKGELVGLLIAIGVLGTLAYAIQWLGPTRRGLTHLPIAGLGLSSLFLPVALFSYAMSSGILASLRRLLWIFGAGLVAGLVLVTGTRLGLVMVLAALPALIRGLRVARRRVLGGLAILAGCTVVFVGLGLLALRLTPVNSSFVLLRFESIPRVITNPGSDLSFQDHLALAQAAWTTFTTEPIVGVGPGHVFNWKGYSRHVGFSTIDTPLGFPAKFGVVGVLVLLWLSFQLGYLCMRLLRNHGPTVPILSLFGFLIVSAALFAIALPLEDKGFSFGLLLLLALGLPSRVKDQA
jgi:hypothetical protein